MAFVIKEQGSNFYLEYNGVMLISHESNNPFLYIGSGESNIEMYRGNFKIDDYVTERVPLKYYEINKRKDQAYTISFAENKQEKARVTISVEEEMGRLYVRFLKDNVEGNRLWMRIAADENEKVYGCGEQMSYFNLRGRNFPLWTSEPGVGRDKSTYVTWMSDVNGMAGGDYYNTNYPQPTFVSTKKYYCHLESTAYLDFDFRNDNFHELQVWDIPEFLMFETADSYLHLVEKLTAYFGRQPELPEWIYNGVILGIQGGTEIVLEKMERAIEKGVKVSGLWCQDWEGKRITSFGKRLMWNWKWNKNEYPGLDTKIHELKERGIRFLGYINPYLAIEGDLYKEGSGKGYFAKDSEGKDYLVDFGEFYCGVVDFTNEEACEWYKDIIKKNLIDFGLDGWMADFGEYLPVDVHLKNGVSAEIMHNAWPAMWAKINYEAVKEAGKLGEVVYFMRAGFTGNQKYCTLMWAGDQSVDFTLHDGLATTICGALSCAIMGNGLYHSDIGGYTSLYGLKRTRELFMRWTEMAAFTPVMRTHEGNRPAENHQFDSDNETLEHLAKMTEIYVKLAPYTKALVKLNADKGIPVQRPLFMHYEEDEKTYDIQYQYLYGEDLMVAPVYLEGKDMCNVYLPEDEWVHLWSGKEFSGGEIEVEAPLGKPAVFYRKHSPYKQLFKEIASL